MNKLTLMIALLALFSMSACAKKEANQMPAAGQPAVSGQNVAANAVEDYIPGQDQYGTVTSCPVMGEKVVVGKGTKAVKYKGKEYFLCCPSCTAQFESNPEKYAK